MANQPKKQRRSPVIVVNASDGSEEETEAKTEQETAADAVIDEATAANPRAPESIIYRKDSESGEERWLGKVASSIVSNEYIAKRWGGGEYRVQHRKPNATGKMVYGSQETYKIDPSVKPEPMTTEADGTPVKLGGGSHIDAIMEAGVMSLITQMQNNNTTQMEMVRSMMSDRGGSKLDWVALLAAVSPILIAIIERTGGKKDTVELAKEIADMSRDKSAPAGSMKDMLGSLKEMLEISDLMRGGGGGDDRSTGERLLEAALPKFMEMAERMGPSPQAGGVPVAPPTSPAQLSAGAPKPELPVWTTFVSKKVPQWIRLAQMDKDPELYAALEVDNMPPVFMGTLRQFMRRDDAIDLVFTAFPALQEYDEWAREFFDEIRALVLGEEIDEEEELDDELEDETGAEIPIQLTPRRPAPPAVADRGASNERGASSEDSGRNTRRGKPRKRGKQSDESGASADQRDENKSGG